MYHFSLCKREDMHSKWSMFLVQCVHTLPIMLSTCQHILHLVHTVICSSTANCSTPIICPCTPYWIQCHIDDGLYYSSRVLLSNTNTHNFLHTPDIGKWVNMWRSQDHVMHSFHTKTIKKSTNLHTACHNHNVHVWEKETLYIRSTDIENCNILC